MDPSLRLSDADRNAALDALSSHFVEGRLSRAEFDERTDLAVRAVTVGDLEPQFEGLPGGVPLTTSTTGEIVPRAAAPVAQADAEVEIEEIRRKGRINEKIDGIAMVTAAVLFFTNLWVFHLPHGWLVWPAGLLVALIGRMVTGFDDSDEKVFEEIKKKDEAERAARLSVALERRRELDDRS